MKRIILVAALSLAALGAASADELTNPYIRKAPEEKPAEPIKCSNEPFAYLPVDCWKGQKIMFMPIREETQFYGYQSIASTPKESKSIKYKEAVGRIGTITNIEEGSPYKDFYLVEITMQDNDQKYYHSNLKKYKDHDYMADIIFLKDIDDARKKYLGMKAWIKYTSKAVTITDIVSSDRNWAPIRFVVKDDAGKEEAFDLKIGKTNESGFGAGGVDDVFAFIDPKITEAKEAAARAAEEAAERKALKEKYKKHKWSKKVWDSIFSHKVFIGMSKLQATLSWGEPASINRSTGSFGVHEQWVYGGSNYLYFENGVLRTIQN